MEKYKYYFRYTENVLQCVFPKFIAAKSSCEKDESSLDENEINQVKSAFECDPNAWYMVSFSDPILEGENKECN